MNRTQGMDELMQLLDRLISLQGGGSPTGQYMPQMQTQERQSITPPIQQTQSGSVGGVPGLLQDYLGKYQYA